MIRFALNPAGMHVYVSENQSALAIEVATPVSVPTNPFEYSPALLIKFEICTTDQQPNLLMDDV